MLIRSTKKLTKGKRRRGASAVQIRDHNISLVLQLAWEAVEISRVELTRQTGLAPSTVSSIVTELLAIGLVRESHAARTRGGRPPIVLRFDDDHFRLLGVDIGATHVAVALTNLRGRVLAWRSRSHAVREDPQGTLQLVEALIQETLDEEDSNLDAVVGVGMGVPSPIDSDAPDQLSEFIIPQWKGVRPAIWLQEQLGVPVLMDNDANLCALAEAWLGSGREVETLAFIKLGTGVGSGLMVDRELMRGAYGFAGEIGHTAIDASGPPCGCGLNGCLQSMVGSAAVIDTVQARLRGGAASSLEGVSPLTLAAVADAAASGDAVAVEAVQQAGSYLGIAIANLFNLINPSKVLLGGALTAAGDCLLLPLREAIRSRSLWSSHARAEVAIGQLGHQTAALGAATLILRAALADPSFFTRHANQAAS